MPSFSVNDKKEPFWASDSSIASGRDPLAIQNSSTTIYITLLMGLTNVTQRIRYYGFYCWILRAYLNDDSIPKKNSKEEEIRHIRRAELLVASMMVEQFPDVLGISGTDYPSRIEEDLIDLIKGADLDYKRQGKEKPYWKFKNGVFGQNFVGVMAELGLIRYPKGEVQIYTTTEKGEKLAEAFEKNIGNDNGKAFWDIVKKGVVYKYQLEPLQSFSIGLIPLDTVESQFYEQLLIEADSIAYDDIFNRKSTIKLILESLAKSDVPISNVAIHFLNENYLKNIEISSLEENTSSYWYLYEVNELIHFLFEHFHAVFLQHLNDVPTSIPLIIEYILENTQELLETLPFDSQSSIQEIYASLESLENNTYDYCESMTQHYRNGALSESLIYATLTLLSVYKDCEKHLESFKIFARNPVNNFWKQGFIGDLIPILLTEKWNYQLDEYLNAILLFGINQHTFSSFQKSRIGQGLVHNYLIEENMAWKLRDNRPTRTTPRIKNLMKYMLDLGWLDKNKEGYSINERGLKMIEKI